MTRMNKLAAMLAMMLAVLGMPAFANAASASPAAALVSCHDAMQTHGSDAGWTESNCYGVVVSDAEADGNGVCVDFWTSAWDQQRRICDPDGSVRWCGLTQCGHGVGRWQNNVHYVVKFRVCESGQPCMPWMYTDVY